MEWSSEAVAAFHDRVAVPHLFVAPARDLVALLELPLGGAVLDVGTGTGLAAALVLDAVGERGTAIGLDPSLPMLRVARTHGLTHLVAARTPGLPFPGCAFDEVLANFVISHCPNYEKSLGDMARVLRPGGKLGVSAWGRNENDFTRLWQEVRKPFINLDDFLAAFRRELPWEEWFSDIAHCQQALTGAGLADVQVHRREYPISMDRDDYLASREVTAQARVMRQMLGPKSWERFWGKFCGAVRARFQSPIQYVNVVHLGIGTKPRSF